MISVGDSVADHTFLVTHNIKWNVILGTDFLHQHSCDIHFNLETAFITLEPAPRTVDVDAISPIPPSEPPTIGEIIPPHLSPADQAILKRTFEPFTTVFTWAGQAVGRKKFIQHILHQHRRRQTKAPPSSPHPHSLH